MLTFEKDFFEKEEKEDFVITSTMKHAWAAQLELLSVLIDVCTQSGIRYYAFWGTLLGSVRHNGFIPWDDDIDIAMPRKDYVRFLEVARLALPEYCHILNVYTEENYVNTFTRVTNGNVINFSDEHMNLFHGCPFVIGIDIFPLDYIPEDINKRNKQSELFNVIKRLLSLAKYIDSNNDISAELINNINTTLNESIDYLSQELGIRVTNNGSVINLLRQYFDIVCGMYMEDGGEYLTSFPEYVEGKKMLFKEEWFDIEQLLFENININVPQNYDEILKVLFGDYMVPVKGGADHEYPFYREQLKIMHAEGIGLEIEL